MNHVARTANVTKKLTNANVTQDLMVLIVTKKLAPLIKKAWPVVDMVIAMNRANACVKIDGLHPIVVCQRVLICVVDVVLVPLPLFANVILDLKVKIVPKDNAQMLVLDTVPVTKRHTSARVTKVQILGWVMIVPLNVIVNVPHMVNV
tara:strand:+ start:116 stop:559 length:444 start_codon:yes stop_codon:yes gene_type:complete